MDYDESIISHVEAAGRLNDAAPTEETASSGRRSGPGRWLVMLLVVGALVGGGYYFAYASPSGFVHAALRERLDRCSSANLFDVHVRYGSPIERDEIVFDLQDPRADARKVDLIHLVYQFAYEAKDLSWDHLVLSARGNDVYLMQRSDVDPLADEYTTGNPLYSIRKWPSILRNPDGVSAYPEYEGGLIGVLGAEMDDVNQALDRWASAASG